MDRQQDFWRSKDNKQNVRVFILGSMEEDMWDNGKITICMGRAYIHGLTADYIKENTETTRSMATGFTNGRMEECMKDGGSRENSLGLAGTLLIKVWSWNESVETKLGLWENGRRIKWFGKEEIVSIEKEGCELKYKEFLKDPSSVEIINTKSGFNPPPHFKYKTLLK